MSTEGLMALIGHEGIVLSRYKDSVGVWTIGIGHTAAAGNPDPATYLGDLTVSEAFGLLRLDITKYEAGVNKAVKVPLKQHEFDALVSFHYNTGAIGKASFVKKLNAGDRAGAMKGMMDWRKPDEIVPRRTSERNLFRDGVYPAPFANIYPATKAGKVEWGKGQRIDLRKALATVAAPPAPAKPVDTPKPQPKPEAAPVPPVASKPARKSPAAAIIAAVLAIAAAAIAYFTKG
jgi:lysozyme